MKNKFGLGTELESAQREVREEVLSKETGGVSWVVDDGTGWRALPHMFDGDQKHFELTKLSEEFEETKAAKAAKDLHRQIGYKRVVAYLAEGQEMVIVGEVSSIDKAENIVHVSPAKSSSVFDVFTRRVKPFLVSTKPVEELLTCIERTARYDFCISALCAAVTGVFFRMTFSVWFLSSVDSHQA